MSKPIQNSWQWFGSPLHFICGNDCRFHLGTLLPNGFVVSTVGAYFPSHLISGGNVEKEGREFSSIDEGENIGLSRKFETMVFRKTGEDSCGCPMIDGQDLDMQGYNDHRSADKGHMAMCKKWAARGVSDEKE